MVDDDLASRVEDASLNATAPPQQRWMDGWIVRTSPGAARRARCINAVAPGRMALDRKLALAERLYGDAGLPLVFRITPFSQPPGLDDALERRGYPRDGATRVMTCRNLPTEPPALPEPDLVWELLDASAFADAVGSLRRSPHPQRKAHAERLVLSPVPLQPCVLRRNGKVLACGQSARESELVGLFDVITAEGERGRGWATALCRHLLASAAAQGARVAYLQTEAGNLAAGRLYERLGFADEYAYHYRQRPAEGHD